MNFPSGVSCQIDRLDHLCPKYENGRGQCLPRMMVYDADLYRRDLVHESVSVRRWSKAAPADDTADDR